MNWLKGLLLTVLGFFRSKANAAVDLRYAGNEQMHRIKRSINEVRDARVSLEARKNIEEARAEKLAKEDIAKLTIQIEELDNEINILESDSSDAKASLIKAANRQVLGRAKRKVEDIHSDLKDGPLSEAIESSDLSAAEAEVRRKRRLEENGNGVLDYQKTNNVMSMEDILKKS